MLHGTSLCYPYRESNGKADSKTNNGLLGRSCFITVDQSAYLKRHSTLTSLHRLIDDILENRNNNEITGLCFLDIQKCFDTIDYTILLDKLTHYGIRTAELKWFQSYLTGRMQVVDYNGKVSEQK